ncbi:MAG: sulfatase-like hydrolase/transferase [Flavobacteriales bacterium]|nr:sulfatase-like hydrolase/transferase [Flavobacteriales bacterium]
MMKRSLHILFAIAACAALRAQSPNILLIIADDMGVDPVPNYMPGPQKAVMPNLEALMADGLTFDNVWADPLCSPTRGTIITGRYGLYTGVLNAGTASLMPPGEITLHSYLDGIGAGYASCIIGKWHLGGTAPDPAYPNAMGVPHYAGLLTGAAQNYFNWNLTVNGTTSPNTSYITTTFTDMALDWIGQQQQPWFCWLAYNAPHTPFHRPPLFMHTQGPLPTDQASINANPLPYYLAMCESVDYELGRIISTLSPETLANTVIIFLGDNGTDANVIQLPYVETHAKATLYEGGVRVPMVMAGPGVTRMGEREPALVNTSDLFTTIVELTGNALPSYENSRSMVPLLTQEGLSIRDCAYTEMLGQSGGFAYRNVRYKYMDPTVGQPRFYDLLLDPWEMNNLLPGGLNAEQQAAFDQLSTGCDLVTGLATGITHQLRMWPNPTSGPLTILNNSNSTARFSIHTVTGSLVREGDLRTGSTTIDLSACAPGLYVIDAGNTRQRIIKF